MKSHGADAFVDQTGQPLSARIQGVLQAILPRVRQRLQSFGDEVVVVEVLEEAGSRIANVEQAFGPVRNLKAYAWTTVLNVARSRLRRSSMRLVHATLSSDVASPALSRLRSQFGTAEQIETHILVEQLMARLTPEERSVCIWKQLGFSSRQIAEEQGTTVACVDTLFYRIKRKVRSAIREPQASGRQRVPPPPSRRTA